jgi:hypothetical protein
MTVGTRALPVAGAYRAGLDPRELATLCLAAPMTLLGAAGWTQTILFANPSPAKYALTVILPMLMAAVIMARRPYLVLVGATIVIAPAATLQMGLLGVNFGALAVVGLLAAGPILLGLTRPVGRSALGRALPWALVLALPAVVRGVTPWDGFGVAVAAVGVAYLCARAVRIPGGVAVVLGSSLASLVLQASVGIWEYLTHREVDLYHGTVYSAADYFFDFRDQPRPTGMFPDPISLGTALLAAIPVGLVAVHLLARARRWAAAVAVGALVAVVGVGLALTLSRMAWLGGLAAVVVVVLLAPRPARFRIGRSAVVLLALLILGALTLGGASLVERASSVSDPTAAGVATAGGDRDREAYWRYAIDAGLANPVAGIGAGNLTPLLVARAPNAGPFTHAHSVYLQIFAESGLLGAAAVALLVTGLLRDLRRVRRRAPILAAGLGGALAGLAVAGLTDVVLIKYVPVAATVAPLAGLIAGLAGRDRAGSR